MTVSVTDPWDNKLKAVSYHGVKWQTSVYSLDSKGYRDGGPQHFLLLNLPWWTLQKPDLSWRLTIDYPKLNQVVVSIAAAVSCVIFFFFLDLGNKLFSILRREEIKNDIQMKWTTIHIYSFFVSLPSHPSGLC